MRPCLALICLWMPSLSGLIPDVNVRAVIFDCDGVLVDTEHLKFLSWRDALAAYGEPFTMEEYMPLVGYTAPHILRAIEHARARHIDEAVLPLRVEIYRELQEQGVPPRPKIVELARTLAAQKATLGIKLAVASSAPKSEILANLRQIGVEDLFDAIVSGSNDLGAYVDPEGTNKPKPYIYIETAKRLGVPPDACLVFEDTKAGVQAAADAGMVVIATPNELTQEQDFSRANAILFEGNSS